LAQIVGVLPWPAYLFTWTVLLFLGFWVAARWWSLPLWAAMLAAMAFGGMTVPVANPAALTIVGNPQVLIAAVVAIGFRYPAAWAFVILTKISPGIGVLWFLVRKEWRNLGIALGVTAVITVVSFSLAPEAWLDFVRFAVANADATSPEPVVPVPFVIRFPVAAAIIAWGARTDRRWAVPLGVGLASLALYEWSALTIWIAALPLAYADRKRRTEEADARQRVIQPRDSANGI
jgi:hypothetical protein